MTKKAHDKGIDSAVREWFAGYSVDGMTLNHRMEAAIAAYLQASGQVVIPREPSPPDTRRS